MHICVQRAVRRCPATYRQLDKSIMLSVKLVWRVAKELTWA